MDLYNPRSGDLMVPKGAPYCDPSPTLLNKRKTCVLTGQEVGSESFCPFAEAVPKVVQGKRISDAKVSKLAGASGCPIGFNDALDQIKKQAAKK